MYTLLNNNKPERGVTPVEYSVKVGSPEWHAICGSMNIENMTAPVPIQVKPESREYLYSIRLIVGGVELNFTKFIKRLYDEHEKYVKNEAKAIVNEKFESLFMEIDALKSKVEQLTQNTDGDW